MAKRMKRCLTKTLHSSDESPVVFREDNHGHDRHKNHRSKNNKKKEDEKKPKKTKQIMKNKKTSRMMRKMIDRRHTKAESSEQTCNLTESRTSRSLQDSPTDVESGDTYNTSVSSSSSHEQPEHGTTSKAAVAAKTVVLPTNTMGEEGIVFSFRPHKSKKKRNGKNVKLTGPMKLSRRLSYKINKQRGSPVTSPITARKLTFTL